MFKSPKMSGWRSTTLSISSVSISESGRSSTKRNMAIRIVRLGSPRVAGEGLRIGTVRRPPRGVPKSEWASRNLFDVWFPNLAPSEELLKAARGATDERSWKKFKRSYLAEMKEPMAKRDLELLAAMSKQVNFAIGCYCADEARCHRSLLREMLEAANASICE